MPENKPTLLLVQGPTASGKTGLAVELAHRLSTVVVSCDSRQLFKEMSIGTASPTSTEMNGVQHFFIDSHSIHNEFSAGIYEKKVIPLLAELFEKYSVVIMVGGSGLYAKAVVEGFDDLPSDPVIRAELEQIRLVNGIEELQKELRERDPQHYENSDIQNPQRLVRALEVCRITGLPYSSFRTGGRRKRNFNIVQVAIKIDRESLYERINSRVDKMMESGWVDEAKSLMEYRNLPALNTVGYKELFSYLDDEISLEQAIELIKMNTRRFAKRQITWLKRIEKLHWIQHGSIKDMADRCLTVLKSNLN